MGSEMCIRDSAEGTLVDVSASFPVQPPGRYFARLSVFNSVNDRVDEFFSFNTLVVPGLGDVNLDGVVNFVDIPVFLALLTTEMFQVEADVNSDGIISFLDIPPFIALLS